MSDGLYASGCSWAPPRNAPSVAKLDFIRQVRTHYGRVDFAEVLVEALGDPPPPWQEAVASTVATRLGRKLERQRARRAENRLCECSGWCDHRRAKGRETLRKRGVRRRTNWGWD
jgi:hypothetical protein